MKYIIAYDIQNDKKRRKVSKILEENGVRLQFSVFECKLNKKELKELKTKIDNIINSRSDSVLIFNLCENCESKSLNLGASYIERIVSIIDL
ncbi:MAG: CRISPR-associated endonuclease Cas2 [Melioribacteraceae bacterium]|nr:CRISPR-associated endonuclease Cas2 [Melioribacteraceae bacterium]